MKVYTSQPSRRQVSRLIKSGNGYSEKTAPFSTASARFVHPLTEQIGSNRSNNGRAIDIAATQTTHNCHSSRRVLAAHNVGTLGRPALTFGGARLENYRSSSANPASMRASVGVCPNCAKTCLASARCSSASARFFLACRRGRESFAHGLPDVRLYRSKDFPCRHPAEEARRALATVR